MRKFLQKYLIIIAAVLMVIFLFQKINWLPSFENIFKSKPVLIEETPVVIKEINTLSQLVTITFTDEVALDTSKIGNGMPLLLATSIGTMITPGIDKLVIIGRGKVISGTDLKNLQQKDITITGDSIHLFLPYAKILETIVNPSGFETFIEEGSWNEDAVIALKIKIRNTIEQHALQQNILHQANERSKNIIEIFLRSTGFKKVEIDISNQSP
ncbi:MAG: DUF4230 domain-containing protein [Bacteroidota bacterium]|nr:DUF4230 domain-containing protein [Bacteroidota bacterium]